MCVKALEPVSQDFESLLGADGVLDTFKCTNWGAKQGGVLSLNLAQARNMLQHCIL